MSSDNWIDTTFYDQGAIDLSKDIKNIVNASLLEYSDFKEVDDFYKREKGLYMRNIYNNTTKIPAKPGCNTEWKWDWKCGSSKDVYSSKPNPLKPTGSMKFVDSSTEKLLPSDESDHIWNKFWNKANLYYDGKVEPQTAMFDCVNQSRSCDVRLHLDDFGVLTIRRLKPGEDEDEILWKSHNLESSQLPISAIPHDIYIPSNTSEQNIGRPRPKPYTMQEKLRMTTEASGLIMDAANKGRSFIFANEKINNGDWLSSPLGMCRLTLNNNELIVEYYESKCTDLQSNKLTDVHIINVVNNPTNIGKMGYIDRLGILHEWPVAEDDTNVSRFGSTYYGTSYIPDTNPIGTNKYTYFDGFTLGTRNSLALTEPITDATDMSACENWCTADKLCSAYSFNNKAPLDSRCNIVSMPIGTTTLDTIATDGGKYAVRFKKIVGGYKSCPVSTNPINAVSNTFWNRFKNVDDTDNKTGYKKGANMTQDQVCGLDQAVAAELSAYNGLIVNNQATVADRSTTDHTSNTTSNSTPNNMVEPFVTNTSLDTSIYMNNNLPISDASRNAMKAQNLLEADLFIASVNTASNTQNNIRLNLNEYTKVQQELYNMNPEVSKQLTAMEDEKRLHLNSIKMRYSILKIILYTSSIVATIFLIKRLVSLLANNLNTS